MHGNVDALLQFVGDAKTVEYEYDLISGNVKCVIFQKGAHDQFMHRYAYDADNRLTKVQTSQDGYVWETDATYYYYAHGPLARVELGEYKVQGLDYYYTLQGWLKGVNTPGGTDEMDLGQDGFVGNERNKYISKDAMGFALGYHEGDYQGIGAVAEAGASKTNFNTFKNVTGTWTDGTIGLFNGNIAWMATDLKGEQGLQGERGVAGLSAPTGLFNFDTLDPLNPINLNYKPLNIETIKLFDFIDYNPLRNIK